MPPILNCPIPPPPTFLHLTPLMSIKNLDAPQPFNFANSYPVNKKWVPTMMKLYMTVPI